MYAFLRGNNQFFLFRLSVAYTVPHAYLRGCCVLLQTSFYCLLWIIMPSYNRVLSICHAIQYYRRGKTKLVSEFIDVFQFRESVNIILVKTKKIIQ